MTEPVELITPYCSKDWADAFYSRYRFDENWNDASDEKKMSALCAATDFIDLYCTFYDESGDAIFYHPTGEVDDYDNEINPQRLKQACAAEACYLLSLDDNPAEPHPLTILGIMRTDSTVINASLVPPIFPAGVVRLIEALNGEVEPSATNDSFRTFLKFPT